MGTWRIARIGGVDFVVKPSLLLMGAALIAIFNARFDGREEPLVLAVGFVLGLYGSVFIHELAHVVTARMYGMKVHSVTLHLMGGETAIEGDSKTPGQELVTAGSGPVTSVAIGLVCLAMDGLTTGTVAELFWILGIVNLFVAAFNMIPGLPLDGGRVARAVIWAITRNEHLGTTITAWIGRITAVAVVVVALLRTNDPGYEFQVVIAILIAWFLWSGASEALKRGQFTARTRHLSVRRLVRREPAPADAPILGIDLSGIDLMREISAQPADVYAVRDTDGTVIGVLTMDDLDQSYREGR